MIEKLLIKRCSTEVQLMVTRMKERPEDFKYGASWRRLVEGAEEPKYPYTWIERKVIRAQWKKTLKESSRKQLLGRIMNETINPTARESIEDGMDAYKYQEQQLRQQLQHRYAQVQAGALNTLAQYNDPRALYGQYGQNTGAQGRVV
jgi:hypothetical protein